MSGAFDSKVVGKKREDFANEEGAVKTLTSQAFDRQDVRLNGEADARAAGEAGAKSEALRNSGQATGSIEVGQSDGPGPLPSASRSSQGGDTGQNIAPTKKRGAYRAAVGGANSIRI